MCDSHSGGEDTCAATEAPAGLYQGALTAGQAQWDTFPILLCVQQPKEVPPAVMPERGDRAAQFPSAKTPLGLR